MQLKKNHSKLALAAASLLGASHVVNVSAADWSSDAAILYYGESDGRVQDGSLKYQGVRTNNEDGKLSLGLTIDSLTGASPSGVAPSKDVQVLTSPSGEGTITHPANELPLDNTFLDTRVSLSVGWDQPIVDDNTRAKVGASVSKEYDYLHLGVSGGLSREFNEKNTTFSVGLAYSADTVEPVGNAPLPLSDQNAAKGASNPSRNILDAVIGVTQVISKNTLLQMNYSISQADGYLNDPYKWVSRVDNTGTIVENLHESRPDNRLGHNLYGALKHHIADGLFGSNILSTSARYHTDDWGVDSITLDTKYRVELGHKRSIEPHIRYYTQTAADFYVPQLDAATALPQYATADYRLAEFDAYTIGATYRWGKSDKREWRIIGELYTQNPSKVALTPGQDGLDANPGFSAAILSLGYKF